MTDALDASEQTVVTIQTQAVRRRLRPDQTREAADLAAVEATAREAMTDPGT